MTLRVGTCLKIILKSEFHTLITLFICFLLLHRTGCKRGVTPVCFPSTSGNPLRWVTGSMLTSPYSSSLCRVSPPVVGCVTSLKTHLLSTRSSLFERGEGFYDLLHLCLLYLMVNISSRKMTGLILGSYRRITGIFLSVQPRVSCYGVLYRGTVNSLTSSFFQ